MQARLRMTKALLVVFALVLLSACAYPMPVSPDSTTGEGTVPPAERAHVTIAVGAPNLPIFLHFEVASALGFFSAEGLDHTFEYYRGGDAAAAALAEGMADFAGTSMSQTVAAQLDGGDLRMLMAFLNQPCVVLAVRSDLAGEIQSAADLRGRRIGVPRIGSNNHELAVFIAAAAGVDAADFEVAETGRETTADDLVEENLDALIGTPPYSVTNLIEDGTVTPLVDLCDLDEAEAQLGASLPYPGLATRADLIAEQPELVQRVVNALVKAHLYIQTHSAEQIVAALPDSAVGDDRATYLEAVMMMLPIYDITGGRIEMDGVATLIQVQTTFGTIEDEDAVDRDALYDGRFVEQALNTLLGMDGNR